MRASPASQMAGRATRFAGGLGGKRAAQGVG
jgi:hypothetical protein